MNKTISKALALALAAAMALTGCTSSGDKPAADNNQGNGTTTDSTATENKGGDKTTASKNEIKDLVISKVASRELETFNILYSQRAEDFENLTNLYDGLLEVTPKGELAPAIATEWGTEDGGLTWTFKLRNDAKWVNMNGEVMADCNAQDFATGLEWVLNYHKNSSSNTSMPIEMIKGAKEYYEYTKELPEAEAFALTAGEGSKFRELVGLATPDDYTVVYTCLIEKPYFDTLAPYVCLYPASQALIDQLGVEGFKSMNNTDMWYNGCYTMTSYIQGNEKIFTKNPEYWDKNCKLFDTVTIKMVESSDVAYQLYQAGEIDYVALSESNVKTISGDPNHQYHDYMANSLLSKYSYQFHWNYNKMKKDGTLDTNWNTAIANEAFRLSLRYGLDIKEYYKRTNTLDPLSCENNFYTMKGLVYTTDGKDYVDLVKEKIGLGNANGETMVRLDKTKAEEYKKQAIEELTALGVTFPIEFDYYILASSQTSLDSANVLKNCFESSLGSDYVQLNINTYVSSQNKEVRDPHLQSFVINGWGADYGDPQNYLGQETYGNDNAWYSTAYSNINDVQETEATKALLDQYKEFTKMVEEADKITDNTDARYNAYAEAEAYMLQHGLVLPCNYSMGSCLTKYNIHSTMNAMFGACNDKIKNWETSTEAYTAEEIAAFKAAKEAK